MLKSSAVLFSVLCISGIQPVYADADMFRIIEHFEKGEIDRRDRMHRSPFAYQPVDPDEWGRMAGTCGRSCKETAAQFKTPIKNGCPVVSEDEY